MTARPKAQLNSGRCRAAAVFGWAAVGMLMPAVAAAQNITYSELKLGVLAHDVHFFGGKERGVDLNPEILFHTPVSDAWAAQVPAYLRWLVQPRPTVGGEINTSGYTSQGYFGLTWSWQLASDVLRPGDGISFSLFEGPSFNNGERVATAADRKSLGSHVLFREAAELGYQIDPVWTISLLLDHESNAGFARYNQSINDFGVRLGFRF
jgi:hypothetical protein